MIGLLSGVLIEKQAPDLLLDVQGVGYEVQAPMSTFYKLPPVGEAIVLYTHFVVREDAQLLYGFIDQSERWLFRALIRVNGVGPKLALAIQSGMEARQFVACVQRNDIKTLTSLPGVGKKTAERLILDMRDRLTQWHEAATEQAPGGGPVSAERGIVDDAESALIALGYKPQEVSRALVRVEGAEPRSSEELIRLALRSMLPAEVKS